MKDVSQYPIKYGFGVTSPAPWSPSHPHLGVDRPTPMRTPLKVNGQLVAYTGNTGGVAAHHHLQKVAGGKVVNPGDGGFVIPEPAVVFAVDNVNDTNIGKALRIRDGQGVEWSHFHLDEILVKTGDKIGGDVEKDKIIEDLKHRIDALVKREEELEHQIDALAVALKNEQNKPPEVVIKEVEKIVEKIVEVPVEVKVGEEEAVRGFFGRLLDLIFKK